MKRINKNNYHQRFAVRLTSRICRQEHIMPITIEVKELRSCGRAIFNSRYISIPLWANRTKEYFIYYVIHEICHFICMGKYIGHGEEFKMIEQEICKRYNIAIQYSKAYPKFLIEYKTGKILCEQYGYSVKSNEKVLVVGH